ncbi:MAG TPA: ribbon-helix-helix protein, CopG family [Coriobacteriia bacterium]
MTENRRSTVYLDADVHRALRLKAAETDRSMSDLVNEAVRAALAEDAEDLAAFADRVEEPTVSYGEFVARLRREGKL